MSRFILYFVLVSAAFASTAFAELPPGWGASGKQGGYEAAKDPKEAHGGKPAMVMRSGAKTALNGSETLGHGFKADPWRGKRVRFSAYLRSEEVTGRTGLWFQAFAAPTDSREQGRHLAFANTWRQHTTGSTPWTRYEVVIDVPMEAVGMTIGYFLEGRGAVWLSDPNVEEVGKDVPLTAAVDLPEAPQLDLGK
jgi:hypothetical protein